MENKPTYLIGLKHGVPTALGYLVVAFTFGMIASQGGISPFYATLISLTSLTSAGQFAGISIMMQNGTYLELMISMLVINSRYMLMSTALSQKIDQKITLLQKMVMSNWITDENFTIAMVKVETITFPYYMGVVSLPYIGWALGTYLGAMMDTLLPTAMQNATAIALYCMFIALFIPPARSQKPIREVLAVTLVLSLFFYYIPFFNVISTGYKVIICAILGAIYGAIRYPQEVV
jgi:predicted branched-subunit amino acid permease